MIKFKNRNTGNIEEELIYGEKILRFLYGDHFLSNFFCKLGAHILFFSKLFGLWQKTRFSKKKIPAFIQKYGIDASEFCKNDFDSFDDFFTRKLKKEARPLSIADAIIPADGRFLFYADIHNQTGFIVKDKKFTLETLLQDSKMTREFAEGSMVIGRLCPSDYHRFHFPISCVPKEAKLINGPLYSVNPISLKKNLRHLCENKRFITEFQSDDFGKVLYIEIGATNVGSIHQTYIPHKYYEKGEEKGYFSFGGSSLILLFKPDTITFDSDLLEASKEHLEMRCLMGQSMGTIKKK